MFLFSAGRTSAAVTSTSTHPLALSAAAGAGASQPARTMDGHCLRPHALSLDVRCSPRAWHAVSASAAHGASRPVEGLTPSTPSTSSSEPACPVLPHESPVLLTPCLAYGVGVRTARCFSACAWRTLSASAPHGASQPVPAPGMSHRLLRPQALIPSAALPRAYHELEKP